jgi:hypothetical protein
MTTEGDLEFFHSSAATRLPTGTSNQVLVGGTDPNWGSVPAAAMPSVTAWLGAGQAFTSSGAAATANTITFFGLTLPSNVTFTSIGLGIGTDDNSHYSDFGFYVGTPGGTCTLTGDIGATYITSTYSIAKVAISGGGTKTLPASSSTGTRVYAAYTSAAGTVAPKATSTAVPTFATTASGVSSGGALPATTTCPSDSWVIGSEPEILPIS